MKRSLFLSYLFLFSILLILPSNNSAQKKKFKYSDLISFGSVQITKRLPTIDGWADDNHYLVMSRDNMKILSVDAATGEESTYMDYSELEKNIDGDYRLNRAIDKTNDYTKFLFYESSDLHFVEPGTNTAIQLTNDEDAEINPVLSPNGDYAAYTKNNNLYCFDMKNDREIQITNDGSDVILNGYSSWVYWEEIFGRKSKYKAFWFSPNSEMIAFMRFDDSPVPKFPLMIYDEIHGDIEWQRYPKAGDRGPYVKLGVYHISSGETIWMDIDEKADHFVAFPVWSADSKKLLFQWMNRGQDNIKIYVGNPNTGSKKEIYDERQQTWVNFFEDIYPLEDNSGFILRTQADGWFNLYYNDYDGNLISKVTDEEMYISEINYVDEQNKKLYFHAYGNPTTDKHFYSVNLDGNDLIRLTSEPGTHDCLVSPGRSYFIDEFSSVKHPKIRNLCDADGNDLREIGNAKGDDFDDYDLGKHELFTIPTPDGLEFPAEWILPSDFDSTKRYPVILSVYGGPEDLAVKNSFPFYKSGYYWANHDVIYMDVDNRGSYHFNKKIMGQVHRNLGKVEIDDIITAAKWLRSLSFIDTTKIGIKGGSYGGYSALMALTRGANYFNYGIANYSVTDWRLYDNFYTERYMDTPNENPEGYEFGAVVNHLDKYKGGLYIVHSTMDDNCHFQNTVQVLDEMTNKNLDFQFMLYPNSRHGSGMQKFYHNYKEEFKFWYRSFFRKEFDPETD